MLITLLTLLACGPSFYDVQQKDTIEAYEAYLAEASPADPNYTQATFRLEELVLEKAREQQSLEGYDMYLDRYPPESNPQLRETALAEREQFLYEWADEKDDPEGWEKFLEEYPRADKKRKQEARRRLKVAEYRDALKWGPIQFERINLAEDPDGPLNGWAITSEVTNGGDKTVTYLNVEVRFKNESGYVYAKTRWPWVAPRFPVPIEEEFKVPVKPGETREYLYTTEEPEGGTWSQSVELRPVTIAFEGEGDDR